MEPDQIGALREFIRNIGPCHLQRTTIASEFFPAQRRLVTALSQWLDSESTALIEELIVANKSSSTLLSAWFENVDLIDPTELETDRRSGNMQLAVSIPLIVHDGRLALILYRQMDFGNGLAFWFIAAFVRKQFHREWIGATILGPADGEPLGNSI